jgi:acyl dehydratase
MSVEVGTEIGPVTILVTRDQVARYAQASGDHNPLHLDDEVARSAGLGGIIAHGMLTMALMGRLVTEWCGRADRVRSYGVRFSHVVRPGDQLTIRGRVASVDEAGGVAHLELSAENQDGTFVLSNGKATVAMKTRSDG